MKVKRILVGLDLDVSSTQVLKVVDFLAQAFGSRILLVHVMEGLSPRRVTEAFFESVRAAADLSMKRATETLDRETAKRTEAVVTYGNTFASIIKKAREEEVDLICIGARREERLASVILGTTAQKTVRKAPCPVLVIKGRKPVQFDHILVPVDFSEPSKQSLMGAIDFAKVLGSKITVLHVVEPVILPYVGFGEAYVPPLPLEEEIRTAKSDLNTFLDSIDFRGVPYECKVRRGRVTEAIRRSITRSNVDLVVMGTHGRTGLPHALVGSTTENVVRAVRCSILTIRPEGLTFVMP